jgi:tRNA U34 5-carboxymethylaminomethyl modifying enzyme MnmG/GidA
MPPAHASLPRLIPTIAAPPPPPRHLLRSYLQKRVLNASKGPAVWALRAQTDKLEYAAAMRRVLEDTPNLSIREGEGLQLVSLSEYSACRRHDAC